MDIVFAVVCCFVLMFIWTWFTSGQNKAAFYAQFTDLNKKIDELSGMNKKLSVELPLMLTHSYDVEAYCKEIKEFSKKVSDQHEEYHNGMLEKLNRAGELIVGYETFYDNSLSELDELSRFVDILSKRPAVSSDPDFTSFVRAVQVMVQILSKYSSVASDLKGGSK